MVKQQFFSPHSTTSRINYNDYNPFVRLEKNIDSDCRSALYPRSKQNIIKSRKSGNKASHHNIKVLPSNFIAKIYQFCKQLRHCVRHMK